jgi:hypothetical protein
MLEYVKLLGVVKFVTDKIADHLKSRHESIEKIYKSVAEK